MILATMVVLKLRKSILAILLVPLFLSSIYANAPDGNTARKEELKLQNSAFNSKDSKDCSPPPTKFADYILERCGAVDGWMEREENRMTICAGVGIMLFLGSVCYYGASSIVYWLAAEKKVERSHKT